MVRVRSRFVLFARSGKYTRRSKPTPRDVTRRTVFHDWPHERGISVFRFTHDTHEAIENRPAYSYCSFTKKRQKQGTFFRFLSLFIRVDFEPIDKTIDTREYDLQLRL